MRPALKLWVFGVVLGTGILVSSCACAQGVLPIRVTLVSCGPTVTEACKRDDRCCGLLHDFEVTDNSTPLANAIYEPPQPNTLEDGYLYLDQIETQMNFASDYTATRLIQ